MGKAVAKKHKYSLIKIVVSAIFIIFLYLLLKGVFIKDNRMKTMYVSSITSTVPLYNDTYEEIDTIFRGESVNTYGAIITNEDIKYQKIIYKDKNYLINIDNVKTEENEIVEETEMYVRTPITIYKTSDTSDIIGYAPKGELLVIEGYDYLTSGNVNMYKVKYNDIEGYVYSKYLVSSKEEAMLNYDEENTYAIHKDRHYARELYGGKASSLDYYPYEKASFTDNIMPEEARTLYLNASEAVLNNIDEYISFAKEANINAFVVDIKDGFLAYQSDVAKEYTMTAYSSAPRSKEDYKKIITKLKDNNFYVIGRIVAFNDSHFAQDNPNEAISKNDVATSWTSAYSRKAWEYNVKLAIEAAKEIGFNEIQFDYVRFPETAYSMSTDSSYNFKNTYGEEKAVAIQNFIFYATDELHKVNTYISIDVFGESANTYVTAYGQYWPAISNIVDVISAMPYPDHFNKYDYGFKEPVWTKPYELLIKWGASAAERQKEIPTPAKVRTWIQAYDAIHDPRIVYDEAMVTKEIKALYDSGLTDGYITWNSRSNIVKYKSLLQAFKKEYR